jgi:CubicO group peptidase (beta-lactamase class C family)
MKSATAAVFAMMLLAVVAYGQQASGPPPVDIHMAALQGNTEAIRRHIEAGSDLDEKDDFGSTPLIIAATFGQVEAAKALIEAGVDMEVRASDGSAPLHVAAFFAHPEIVKALLAGGADRYARNMGGATAFDIVSAPFDVDRRRYDELRYALAPVGLRLDYERIENTRPEIAELLRPRPEDLEAAVYEPLSRDDFMASTPEEQGLDPKLVAELYLDAAHMETLYGLLIVKNGHLIAEGYYNGGSVNQEARLQSVTKSFTSALVGIALEQECLSSVDQKMLDFFPELAGRITDPRKEEIAIRHLLQMRAGYPWEETDSTLWAGLLSGHYPPLIEEFQLIADPGTEFNYSNLSSNLLGIILDRACGMDLKSFAEEYLFSPIGAQAGEWGQDAEGHNNGCGDLHTTARDAAKFGLLYLNGGEHDGNQVIPAGWVRESLQSYSDFVWVTHARQNFKGRYFRDLGYGYQWWSARVGKHRFDYASGHGGQLIILLHHLDMIIVVTSEPFYLVHDAESWKHEQACINLVGKFIKSLPKE